MIFCWLSAPKMMQNMSCPLCFLRMQASQEPGESTDSRQRLRWPTSWAPMVPFIDNPWIFGQHPLPKYILHICIKIHMTEYWCSTVYISHIHMMYQSIDEETYMYIYTSKCKWQCETRNGLYSPPVFNFSSVSHRPVVSSSLLCMRSRTTTTRERNSAWDMQLV